MIKTPRLAYLGGPGAMNRTVTADFPTKDRILTFQGLLNMVGGGAAVSALSTLESPEQPVAPTIEEEAGVGDCRLLGQAC